MEEIYKAAAALGDTMSKSESYENYCRYKEAVQGNITLWAKMMQFKKSQFDLENRRAQGFQIAQEEEWSLSENYHEILLNEDCAAFLKAEREVITLLSHVFEIIGAKVKVDLNFLD